MARGLYVTQGGGTCIFEDGLFRWVEPPEWLNAHPGERIPEEWGVRAVNDEAHQEMEDER